MSVIYVFQVMVDFPEGTDTHEAESVVASAAAAGMHYVGTPGNVMCTLVKVITNQSITDLSPNSFKTVDVKSKGVSTSIAATMIPPKESPFLS